VCVYHTCTLPNFFFLFLTFLSHPAEENARRGRSVEVQYPYQRLRRLYVLWPYNGHVFRSWRPLANRLKVAYLGLTSLLRIDAVPVAGSLVVPRTVDFLV